MEYYRAHKHELFVQFSTSEKGLSSEEAASRLHKYGNNELQRVKKGSILLLFLRQFNDFLMYLLLFAAAISLLFKEYLDASAMLVIAIISAILGFVQEYRANKAMEALEKMSAPHARVIRNGEEKKIPAKDLVPGDMILLEAGDIVPADCRIIESYDFKVDEASLTGESVASKKDSKDIASVVSITEQRCMAFMSTAVTYGKARCIVVGTGMSTEMGKIAASIQSTEEAKIPLQIKFRQMAKQIGFAVISIIAIVFFLSLINRDQGLSIFEFIAKMLIFALSLAVAAIPNSLPAIVTISLAMGAKVLAKKNMIIKHLPAAESLGSATVICTDKTGTITKNEMTVTKMFFDGRMIDVTGSGYAPEGGFLKGGKKVDVKHAELLFRIGALCNTSRLVKEDGKYSIIGDPTEGSLVVLAEKAGFGAAEKERFSLIQELSFDSERKRMTVIYDDKRAKKRAAYVKGAPDILLDRCDRIYSGGKVRKITASDKKNILSMNHEFAAGALRVLAFAYKDLRVEKNATYDIDHTEKCLVFVGIVGMIDPPREEVAAAIQRCGEAGIRVMVITGDHADTARAVAEKIGLFHAGDSVLTGAEIDAMSDSELEKKIESIRIIARALPIQKLRIVAALKKQGHLVAMTGDGVNDAPALKSADIGIAMGITGTDVAKEVSGAVLADDNFATIVNAVSEGRNMYDKIIKSARYMLSCNTGEVVVVFSSILAGLPLPMIPLQILLMNLFTDGMPALALAAEKSDADIMQRLPRDPSEPPINLQMLKMIIIFGVSLGVGSMLLFAHDYVETGNLEHSRTVAFTTLVMLEMFAVYGSRSFRPFGKINPLTNPWLILAVSSSIALQLCLIYLPPLQSIFETVALSGADWTRIMLLSGIGYLIMEFSKFFITTGKTKKVNV